MSNFTDFLQDYGAHEKENVDNFIKRLDEGKVAQSEKYPPKNRFIKLSEPIADPYVNIWGMIPFYGSTLVKIMPKDNRKSFDDSHEWLGFNSRKIDEMIDFQKETGKIQFVLTSHPTLYKNLDFLEPLFTEVKPPVLPYDTVSIVGQELDKKHKIEFETLAIFGFNQFVEVSTGLMGNSNPMYISAKLDDYASRYSILKASGYEELADEIGTLMIIDPAKAHMFLVLFGFLIANPQKSLLKPICGYDKSFIDSVNEYGSEYNVMVNNEVPYEIGKFLLNKIVYYPETMEGCKSIIQKYDDQELYKIMGSLNEGVKRQDIDKIEEKEKDISDILDNVWSDANIIKKGSDGIKFGVSLSLGLIGGVAGGIEGSGIMSFLGYTFSNTVWGMQDESISEKMAKFATPNHLVSIYDFKKKHDLND